MMRLIPHWSLCLACLVAVAASGPLAAAERPPRYAGLRADGVRFTGKTLTTTPADPKSSTPPDWQLDGQPLWDSPQPPRWLRDRQTPLASTPPVAYVELIAGDRVPGEVVGFDDGNARPYDPLPPHLLVRTSTPMSPPQPVQDPVARIWTRYVRRVVWQRREVDTWQPGTAFYRDGRSTTFRALRWGPQSLSLLASDGPRAVPFTELAEVHLPVADFWDAYWEELATLSPSGEGRLWQFETGDGLILTTSRERSRLHHPGGAQDAARWIHGLHPAWSLDLLWVPQDSVAVIRSFASRETPLSRVALSAQRQQGWFTEQGTPARWNRNIQRGSLRGGDGEYGWGFGVQAISRLEFLLPPAARVFRGRIGLDRSAGNGGCIRARVFVGDNATPAYESPFLVGSETVADTGSLAIPANSNGPTRLALEVDAAHEGRPPGADPFDIRDLANWLDPLIEFDLATLKAEIARRNQLPSFTLRGWTPGASPKQTSENASAAPTRTVSNAWDELAASPGRFALIETFSGSAPAVWTRELRLEPPDRWLVVAVATTVGVNPPPRIEAWIDDELAGEQNLAVRNAGQRDPPPLLVDLRRYADRTVRMELRLFPSATPAPISWRVARMSSQPPTLFEIVEDDADWVQGERGDTRPTWDAEDRVSGRRSLRLAPNAVEETLLPSSVAVRESPVWGEFRYLRLAFRKEGGGQVSLEFLPAEPRERPLRLDGGAGPPAFGEASRFYQAALPKEWVTIPVDLFSTLGRFDARGVRLAGLDGGATRFDGIYLARTQGDFELIPFVAGPVPHPPKVVEETRASIARRVAPSLVRFTGASGKPAHGVLVGAAGEILTTGQAVREPNRSFMVTLSDGKVVVAKSKGIHREADLALLQIEPAGSWPVVEVLASPTLQSDLLYAHVGPSEAADGNGNVEVMPTNIWRTTRATLWTDADGPRHEFAALPLVDTHGRLVGFASRRHGTGLLDTRVVEWPAVSGRLRAGEAWGEWPRSLANR